MKRRSLPVRLARWVAIGLFAATLGSVVVVAGFRWLPVPLTAFMIHEWIAAGDDAVPLRQRHEWVPWSRISRHLEVAAIAAEDQKFLVHDGFDFEAIEKAVNDARSGRRLRGASTISQQVAKNLFLWPGQSWLRKSLEVWFTVWIEWLWPKQRILEVYLNSAQFGHGVWGVEAASRQFFGKGAAVLGRREAALLAAVLPSPNRLRISNPSHYVRMRQAWILGQMQRLERAGLVDGLD
ncbi:MAG TPA: monofunctional biosynthetic peptidoglycan transglycosylase [Steroidobacteraceae bacterium]